MKINKITMFDLLNRNEKLYFGEHINSMSKITLEQKLLYSIDTLTKDDYASVSNWEKHLVDAEERIVSMKEKITLRNEKDTEIIELLNEISNGLKDSCADTKRSLLLAESILQTKLDTIQAFQTRVDNMLELAEKIELV